MELAKKVVSAAVKATNSNAVVNACLGASFVALSVRSVSQQRHIEALESEKESLAKDNKSKKKTLWDWKQQLFAEAEAAADSPLVPLAKLKSIYGEAPDPGEGTFAIPAPGEVVKAEEKSSPNKFLV